MESDSVRTQNSQAGVQDNQALTRDWYRRYSDGKGHYRNSLLKNPEVLFQLFSYEASVISAVRHTKVNAETTLLLDVGCGAGGSTELFLRLGFVPSSIWGVDFLAERIAEASQKYGSVHFLCEDATQLSFPDSTFPLVSESTMFVQITDETLACRISKEMLRVTADGGHILICDWRDGRPGHPEYRGVSSSRLRRLFPDRARLEAVYRGTLVPPLGRFLSRRIPSLYFLGPCISSSACRSGRLCPQEMLGSMP